MAARRDGAAEYSQLGLQAPHLYKEPDDHIGLEFDFVAQVLVRALEELERRSRKHHS